ncbi:MAG TPA: hypothetical protein VG406_07810 [Isosphaeraceae bacterium]|jgi:hypothetical protein|nr:hypothetical protein [Isosphaeraceae bacterium]
MGKDHGRTTRSTAIHFRPAVERAEARELPSGIIASISNRAPAIHGAVHVSQSASPPTSGNGFLNNPGSPLLGQGTPTPAELARENFHAYFRGPYSIGPGRFSDQAQTLFIRGVGSSNFFFHGNIVMAVVTPTNPDAPPFGTAVLNDKNINSSGVLGLDFTATAVDSAGRATQLTFTQDPNIYSGTFFVDSAIATATVRYQPTSAHGGIATVVFQGRIYTSGLAFPLRNSDLVTRGGRLG